MKIIVTGGCGFLGSNMVKMLLDKNNKILVIDNLSSGKIENCKPYFKNKNFKFINLDITDNKIIKLIKNYKPDRIYNFACPASPKFYQKYPIETWKASVIGIYNILMAIKNTKTRVLQTSTSEVYGDALINPQVESYWGNVNPIGIRACYDEGKRAAEAIIYDFIRSFNCDIRVARIFNSYGPNMCVEDGRIISNFIVQALSNKDITIYGSGNQTRSFCFVSDTINGLYSLMEINQKILSPINIGNPSELSVNQIADKIKYKIKSNSNIIHLKESLDDPHQRKPDIEKATKLLNWKPTISLDKGLNETIKYFKNLIGVI